VNELLLDYNLLLLFFIRNASVVINVIFNKGEAHNLNGQIDKKKKPQNTTGTILMYVKFFVS